jgi:putative transposase
MGMYRKWSHTTYDCRYHLVWITKYRNPCLSERIQNKLKILLKWICKTLFVKIISIWMEEDHVHMYISIPLSKPIPKVVKLLKWSTSKYIRKEFREELKEWYWKPVLWAEWYFIATVWEINHEIIKNYVDMQWEEENKTEEIEL